MYHIIVNESKFNDKNRGILDTVKNVFKKAGKELKIHFTCFVGHAKEIAQSLTSDGAEKVVISMGGDGTLHEVVNGIVDFDKTTIGLIPFGTGNDFASTLNLPLDVEKSSQIVLDNNVQYVDFIELASGLRSINAVGMGIDVDVLKRTYSTNKQGKMKYFFSLLDCLMKFKSYDINLILEDGTKEEHKGLIAACGNGKRIGGGIKVFPEAKVDDGLMDVIVVDYISKIQLLGALLKLMRGKINKIKQAKVMRCTHVEFQSPEDTTIEAEGELYEGMQLNATLIANKLKFLLPKKIIT